MTKKEKAYAKLMKGIAKVDHDIRLYRINAVLVTLLGAKQKALHLKKLETKLSEEIHKKLQAPVIIDALLDELEARLGC
jgi:hypothetical protein